MSELEQLKENLVYLRATISREYTDKDGIHHNGLFSFKDFKTRTEAEEYLKPYVGKTAQFKGGFQQGITYRFNTYISLVRLVPAAPFLYNLNW